MLFDWLVTCQVVPMNPAAAVRRPKHVVTISKTPVLYRPEWRTLFDSIQTDTVRDLRDRALIGTLTYSFARIGAVPKMKVEDVRPQGAGWEILLHEKGGKEQIMACHHQLAALLHAYIAAADIAEDRKGWLFRTSPGHNDPRCGIVTRVVRRRRRPRPHRPVRLLPTARPGGPKPWRHAAGAAPPAIRQTTCRLKRSTCCMPRRRSVSARPRWRPVEPLSR
jgi:site-specific recombinase XerC